MRLGDYLKRNKISDKDFAARTGMHYTEVWNYRTGRRLPGAQKIAAIEEATGGKVRARDFVDAA